MNRTIPVIFALAGALLGTAASALAADMPVKAPPLADPPVSWTGLYVGGNAGGAWATTSDSNAVFAATTGNFHISGAVGGG